MVSIVSSTGLIWTLLCLYPISPSKAFVFIPTPLDSTRHHEGITSTPTDTGTAQQRNLHRLLSGSGNSDEQIPSTTVDDESTTTTSPTPISQSQAVIDEASDALQSVGWSAPMTDDELTSDDPFVKRIESQIYEESGVGLDQLLNPAKVVNLERDLYNLRSELALLTGKGSDFDVLDQPTEACIGELDGGEAIEKLLKSIGKKEQSLFVERKAVFRDWLKNVFLGQAVLSLGLSYVMVTDPAMLFGGFDWFSNYSMDVSIKVLGFWWWWLFIVPSLRSRRPTGFEKKALDIAFLGTPAISITAPIVTKDQAIIWGLNFAIVAGSYGFAYLTYDDNSRDGSKGDQPKWLEFIYNSLDFGSGKERGIRK